MHARVNYTGIYIKEFPEMQHDPSVGQQQTVVTVLTDKNPAGEPNIIFECHPTAGNVATFYAIVVGTLLFIGKPRYNSVDNNGNIMTMVQIRKRDLQDFIRIANDMVEIVS